MRIASLNIANYDDHPHWEMRRLRICNALYLLQPQVILLQEVRFNPQLPDCANKFQNAGEELLALFHEMNLFAGYRIYSAPAMYYPSRFSYPSVKDKVLWEGKSIITCCPLREYGNYFLSLEDDAADINQRSLFWAKLKYNNKHLTCINLHWSTDEQCRRLNAVETLSFAQRFAADPTVIMGDFNCEYSEHEPAFAAAGWLDAWETLSKEGAGNTFPAAKPSMRIDRAYINKAFSHIISDVSLKGTEYLSDHKILVLDLEL